MAQNNENKEGQGVDNPMNKVGKTVIEKANHPLGHIIMTAMAAAGIAIVHAFFTELDGCAVVTAEPETAGMLGATIRAIFLAAR